MVTTESGLQYKDIKPGTGPSPPIGFQVRTLTLFFFLLGNASHDAHSENTCAQTRSTTLITL
jgi:hypothetical protein